MSYQYTINYHYVFCFPPQRTAPPDKSKWALSARNVPSASSETTACMNSGSVKSALILPSSPQGLAPLRMETAPSVSLE